MMTMEYRVFCPACTLTSRQTIHEERLHVMEAAEIEEMVLTRLLSQFFMEAVKVKARTWAARKVVEESFIPVDGSYPPDPEGEPGEEIGSAIADQFKALGTAYGQMGQSVQRMMEAYETRPKPFLMPAVHKALRK